MENQFPWLIAGYLKICHTQRQKKEKNWRCPKIKQFGKKTHHGRQLFINSNKKFMVFIQRKVLDFMVFQWE
jgi:hypothetical protein